MRYNVNISINDYEFAGNLNNFIDIFKKHMEELIEKMNINTKCIDVAITPDKKSDIKITLSNMDKYLKYTRTYLENAPITAFNWTRLTRNNILSEKFIDNFQDKVNWFWIIRYMDEGKYKFSKWFLNKYSNKITEIRKLITSYDNIEFYYATNPIEPIKQTEQSVYPDSIYGDISTQLRMPKIEPKPEDTIDYILPDSQDETDTPNLITNGHISFPLGIPQINPYNKYKDNIISIEDEIKRVASTPITPENFEDLFGTPIYKLPLSMIDDIVSTYILTPKFVYKYEEIIDFETLMNNPNFHILMKDDKFFDRYIDKFKNIKNKAKFFKIKRNMLGGN